MIKKEEIKFPCYLIIDAPGNSYRTLHRREHLGYNYNGMCDSLKELDYQIDLANKYYEGHPDDIVIKIIRIQDNELVEEEI